MTGRQPRLDPLFSRSVDPKGSVFVASVVLAIMILPIVTAISRDVFAQTPRDHIGERPDGVLQPGRSGQTRQADRGRLDRKDLRQSRSKVTEDYITGRFG